MRLVFQILGIYSSLGSNEVKPVNPVGKISHKVAVSFTWQNSTSSTEINPASSVSAGLNVEGQAQWPNG